MEADKGNRALIAAETYAARIDAVDAQHRRLHGEQVKADRWEAPFARTFRFDPHRDLDANLEIIASYVQAHDTLVDAGGGAGRICLPLALRCRQVINVEPSPGMVAEFEACSAEAGITNARLVQANWPEADGVRGDLAFSADVLYFVRDIVPFVEKLDAVAARRAMITLWSVPPTYRNAKLFQLVYGEEQEAVPGHRQLLPVLWEMGILPDVRVLPCTRWWDVDIPRTREEAVELAMQGRWLSPEDRPRARDTIAAHFQDLFTQSPEGYRPIWWQDERELLISWETDRQ